MSGQETRVAAHEPPRRLRWLKTLIPLALCACATTSASAQQMAGPMSYGAPAFMAGGGPPATSGVPTAGLPQSFQSSPYISPFDHAFEQHFNSDGLWFRKTRPSVKPGGPNAYFFNIEYLNTRYKNRGGLYSDPSVSPWDYGTLPDDAPGNFPDTLFYNVHDAIRVGRVPDVKADGIRIRGGFENDNEWGFSWNALYNPESQSIFDARALKERQRFNSLDAIVLTASQGVANGGIPPRVRNFQELQIVEEVILGPRIFDVNDVEFFGATPGPYGTTFNYLNRTLMVLPGLNMQNGTGVLIDPDNATVNYDPDGIQQIFDLQFNLSRVIQTWGGGAQFTLPVSGELGGVRLRPLVGGRYLRIDEGYFFQGVDSGLAYTRSAIQNAIDDNGNAFIDEVDEAGGAQDFTQNNPSQQILIRSFMNSTVRSDLYGPEIGVEYNLSNVLGLDVTGSTRVGALFNTEKLSLAGDNIGDTSTVVVDPTDGTLILQDMFDTTTLDGPSQNAFSDHTGSTHLSPMLEQSLNVELALFENVPVLRDAWQLENAKVRLGWTFTLIGEVADPNESIVWVSNPRQGLFPQTRAARDIFYQNTFSAGINWEY